MGRIFGVFGPGQKGMLAAQIRRKVELGEPVQLSPHPADGADGGLKVSFIFNADLGRLLTGLAEKALAGESLPGLMNIGGSQALSLRLLAEELGRRLGRRPEFEFLETPRQFDLAADVGLLRRTLSPSFTPLDEALKLTCGL